MLPCPSRSRAGYWASSLSRSRHNTRTTTRPVYIYDPTPIVRAKYNHTRKSFSSSSFICFTARPVSLSIFIIFRSRKSSSLFHLFVSVLYSVCHYRTESLVAFCHRRIVPRKVSKYRRKTCTITIWCVFNGMCCTCMVSRFLWYCGFLQVVTT